MLALKLIEILYAIEHIGIEAELIFKPLGRCVRKPSECAKVGGVYEILIAELADIDKVLAALDDVPCGLFNVAADTVELRKIVR